MPPVPKIRNTPVNPARQDTWSIIVQYKGNNMGYWDKKSGGEVDSDDTKYYPGGMQPPISLGGRQTTGNVTLQRIWDANDATIIGDMLASVGKAAVTITQRPRDIDGNPYGDHITYNGILKRVLPPETDSESGSAALLEIEVTVNGIPEMT